MALSRAHQITTREPYTVGPVTVNTLAGVYTSLDLTLRPSSAGPDAGDGATPANAVEVYNKGGAVLCLQFPAQHDAGGTSYREVPAGGTLSIEAPLRGLWVSTNGGGAAVVYVTCDANEFR